MRQIMKIISLALVAASCLSLVGCTSPVKPQVEEPEEVRRKDPCAVVRCGFGTVCRPVDGKANCVQPPAVEPTRPPPRISPCALVKCLPGLVCKNIDGRARCVNAGIVAPGTGGIKPPRPNCDVKTSCMQVYQPVCGSDGQTYSNACVLNSAACQRKDGLYKLADGPCERPMTPPVLPPPVESDPNCQQLCSADYSPVCGSDGKTYSNECNMSVDACLQKTKITVDHKGECAGKQQASPPIKGPPIVSRRCPIGCPKTMLPVCGTDNKTYGNECLLTQARCDTQQPSLQVKYKGRCVFEGDKCDC